MISFNDIPPLWRPVLKQEWEKPYIKNLQLFLEKEIKEGKILYPEPPFLFYALKKTPPDNVSIVILGQDPYHGEKQAHGLAFSVPYGVKIPPSLLNIYKELQQEYQHPQPQHGNLTGWAEQGVLLLNSTLTVQHKHPASHHHKGWENLTDYIITYLATQKKNIVFMLWGKHAQQKKGVIFSSSQDHLILEAPHPSPLSAHRGFIGCQHFIKANEYLKKHQKKTIDWFNLP